MTDDITSAIKRREYGWFFLYIFVIIVGTRLAGIGGIVGASLIAFGLYRTNKNSSYSVLKKLVLPVAYVLGGVVATIIIATLLSWLVLSFSRQQAATTQSVGENRPTLNEGRLTCPPSLVQG